VVCILRNKEKHRQTNQTNYQSTKQQPTQEPTKLMQIKRRKEGITANEEEVEIWRYAEEKRRVLAIVI